MDEFRNESGLDFTDITSEVSRAYHYPGGDVVRIPGPRMLNVSASGGHRIWAEDGCHYIPPGWIQIHWVPREGAPHFVR